MKRERVGGTERQSDGEFDEFIRVRSWVAWSQAVTVVEKAGRSIVIDTAAVKKIVVLHVHDAALFFSNL